MGLVPLLVDGDFQVSQSVAIIHYLDNVSTQSPRLFPTDAKESAKVLELVEIINSGIQPIQNLSTTKAIKAQLGGSKEQILTWNQYWISEGFSSLEKHLEQTASTFCHGGEVTAADCFLVPQVYNAERYEIDMSKFPIIQSVNERLKKLQPVIDAHPDNQPDKPR